MNYRLAFLTVVLVVSLSAWACAPTPAWEMCTEGQQLKMHLHAQLSIWLDGKPVEIPAGIGMKAGCTRPIHTHEADGVIHIESSVVRDFTLGDFSKIWGEELSNSQVQQYKVADGYKIQALADGSPVAALPGLTLKDGQRIIISITSPPRP